VLAAVVGAVLVLATSAWLWLRPRPPAPPLPDLNGADPEVAEVVNEARRSVLERPTSAAAWGKLGMVFRAHDFDRECVACFAEAERLDPREPRWPYLKGITLALTDPDVGIRSIERAVELCQDDPLSPRLRLAEVLLERDRLDEARAHLDRALQVEPDNRRARLGLGRLALLREDWHGALGQLAACVQDEHVKKLAFTLQAEAWSRLGDPDRARADQAKAAEAPDDTRWPDPFVDEVVELQRGLSNRHSKADALARNGQAEDAIRLLEETAEKYPRSLQTWWRLGDLWRKANRIDRAEQALLKAVLLDPDAAEGWFRLGCVQAIDRPREAAESFRRAIKLRPDHALAHFNLAHRLRELGDKEGAMAEFEVTLRCRPDYTPARAALKEITLEALGPAKNRK
jgi:tetratricopeptide (TPR) repeat protein